MAKSMNGVVSPNKVKTNQNKKSLTDNGAQVDANKEKAEVFAKTFSKLAATLIIAQNLKRTGLILRQIIRFCFKTVVQRGVTRRKT